MLNEIILSLLSYTKAVRVIKKYNLLKYAFILVLLVLFFVLPVVFIGETLAFFSKFIPFLDGEKYARVGASFLTSFSGFFLLLLLIPIFTLISDEVNYKIRGVKNNFSLQQFIADSIRGLKITLRNLAYQYISILLILFFLRFFTSNIVFVILGKAIIFIITSYFYGFSLMDYAMENHQMNYKKSVAFMRSHIGLAIGLGLVYYAIISINNVGFVQSILGNFATYWSVIAEAFVAFIGVIAANIVLNIVIKKHM